MGKVTSDVSTISPAKMHVPISARMNAFLLRGLSLSVRFDLHAMWSASGAKIPINKPRMASLKANIESDFA